MLVVVLSHLAKIAVVTHTHHVVGVDLAPGVVSRLVRLLPFASVLRLAHRVVNATTAGRHASYVSGHVRGASLGRDVQVSVLIPRGDNREESIMRASSSV